MAEAVTIARPYAVAVFRLAREKNTLAKWSDMLALAGAVVANPQIHEVIDDPRFESAEIERLMQKICGDKLNAEGGNLIKLLIEYGRLALLPEIAHIYEELKAQDEGTLEAEITASAALTDVQVQTLVDRLQKKFGKKVEASVHVDPEIIGGIKIVIGDTVIDASVRGQLQNLAYTLKS
ncbi:MAG: F0F1 ATP synthase subunit delta [Methylobacillus sp.]|jgi:F-type H+-transporting ATPase subunit delta|nr:F0F1 ATP synthase subunit delta [Methylobacillus sp.]